MEENGKNSTEIEVGDIIRFLKKSKKAALFGAVAGIILWLIFTLATSNQYTSQVTIMPEVQTKNGLNLGNLSSLAGIAGVNLDNLNGSSELIKPELYSTILQSKPFAFFVLKQAVYSQEFMRNEPLESYLNRHKSQTVIGRIKNTIGLTVPVSFDNNIPQDQIIKVSKEQEQLISDLQNNISATYDKKTSLVIVNATMPDPTVAAMTVNSTLDFLKSYIISYKTAKAKTEAGFLERQVQKAKQRYESAEVALSSFRDHNQSLYQNTAKIQEQRLQAEYLLSQDIYNTLTKQLEMARIKIQEETPVFKILDPAQIPWRKSGPGRIVLFFAFLILGIGGAITQRIFIELIHWIRKV